MKDRFPTLFERASVRPRVHRVFGGICFALALGLVLALVAGGDGEMGARFSRALGKGIILIVAGGAYFGWALTLRATRDPVWAALVSGSIVRIYPYIYTGTTGQISEPRVGVETRDGQRLVVECQTLDQQKAIIEEFRVAGSVQVLDAAP